MTAETTAVTVIERAAVALGSSKAETELTALAAKSKDIIAITNSAGREECHAAAMVARSARVAIDKTAKAARDDATAFSRAVIAEGSRLVALIEPEESRLIALRDEWDEKIVAEKAARAEAERVALEQIKTRIDNIKAWPMLRAGASSAFVLDDIARLEALEVDDSFGASYGEAVEAKAVSLAKLREIHAAKVVDEIEAARIRDELAAQAERNRIEREELDRQRAEQHRIACEAQAEQAAELQRLADARAEIAAAQRVLDEAKAEAQRQADTAEREAQAKETARIAAQAAAAQKVIDDAAAEAKRAADAVAAQQAEQRKEETAAPAPFACIIDAPSHDDAIRHDINKLVSQMTGFELIRARAALERILTERQAAA